MLDNGKLASQAVLFLEGGSLLAGEGSIQRALLANGVATVTHEEMPGITKGITRKFQICLEVKEGSLRN